MSYQITAVLCLVLLGNLSCSNDALTEEKIVAASNSEVHVSTSKLPNYNTNPLPADPSGMGSDAKTIASKIKIG